VVNAGGETLSQSTVMRLTLSALERTGIYSHSIRMWRDRPDLEHTTLSTFRSHFVHGNKERLRLLTASTAGYRGTHDAFQTHDSTPTTSIVAATQVIPSVHNSFSCNSLQLGYCWTHSSLTKKHEHTSATCAHPAPGHHTHAALDKRLGGSARMFSDVTKPSCTIRAPTNTTSPSTPPSNV